jgi:cyanophycinase
MRNRFLRFIHCFTLALGLTLTGGLAAQVFDERFDDWPIDLTINGQVIIAPGDTTNARLQRLLVDEWSEQEQGEGDLWIISNTENAAHQLDLPHEKVASKSFTYNQVSEELLDAEAPRVMVWTDVRKADAIPPASLEQLAVFFRTFVRQGGTLIVVGAPCEAVSRYIFTGGTDGARLAPGMNLLPDCVLRVGGVESGFDVADSDSSNASAIATALQEQPACVGIELDENTALTLRGRKMWVRGDGHATFVLHQRDSQSARRQSISEADVRERPSKWMVDLTQWRREAKDRTLEEFPPRAPQKPYLNSGTLLIVGGGGMPEGLMDQFIELAGGNDAKLVYIPCAEQLDVGKRQSMVVEWKEKGIENATFIHTKDRNQANEDNDFLEPLRSATGIWLGGGRQWNFSDSYYGTQAHRLMKEVLARGGVIGGSSAGASIQARYLARATPIENFDIMAPGYERGGLGFISGVAIDQHFSQRGRHKDMTSLVERYPQLLGIGIDEATAIVVQKSIASVVGRGKVHFYDRNQPVIADAPDFIALEAGQVYDLALRKLVSDATE